ncbi:MAG: PxKF domain-containing protein [Candidatus Jorgensenbacteria bacterium]
MSFGFAFLIVGALLFIIGRVPLAEAAVQQLVFDTLDSMEAVHPAQGIGTGLSGSFGSLTIKFLGTRTYCSYAPVILGYPSEASWLAGYNNYVSYRKANLVLPCGSSVGEATHTISAGDFPGGPVVFNPSLYYVVHLEGGTSGTIFGKVRGSGIDVLAGGQFCRYMSWQDPAPSGCSLTVKDMYFDLQGVSPAPPAGGISISNLGQFKSDATSTIPEGSATTEDTIVFGATLQSSSTDQLQLQVEVQPSSMPFTNQPTSTSTLVNSGEFATTAANLSDGEYHWQARAADSQNNVSEWQEFGTPSNTDFVIHQVPLYTQVISDFPSQADTKNWARETYAEGRGNIGPEDQRCGLTIRDCGCAITSAVMVLRYYDITTGTDNQDVNPLTFNNWLNANNGYVGNGNLDWVKVVEYSRDSLSGIARLHYDGRRDIGDNFGTTFNDLVNLTDSYVNSARPVIAWIPSFGHFLVANEKLANNYAVRDPAWYNTRTLDSETTSALQRIRDYNNQFEGVRLYSHFSGPVDGISLNLASPAELLVIDPQGRRLGRDPISNIVYSEILNSSYGRDGISNADTEVPDSPHIVKNIWVPEPITGSYEVKVIGTASGTYSLNSLIYDASSTPHLATFSGITAPNSETDYTLNYSTSTPQEISVKEVYKFLGFLPPVKSDGSGVCRLGRTLPVKFQLKNALGQFVTNTTATLTVAKIQDGIVGTEEVAFSSGNSNAGNTFRYDFQNDQYIFNLNTGTMTAGTWQLKLKLDDGKSYTVLISLRN